MRRMPGSPPSLLNYAQYMVCDGLCQPEQLARRGRTSVGVGSPVRPSHSIALGSCQAPAARSSGVSEQKVQFHDPVVVDRHDREGAGPLEAVVTEDDRDRAGHGVASGLSNAEIGGRLGLAEEKVKHYMTSILGKLGVASRVEAALLAYKAGLASGKGGPTED